MSLTFSRAATARILPFAVFMLLLVLRGALPEDGSAAFDARWVYAANLLIVGGLLGWYWREYGELASAQTLPSASEAGLAVGVGLLVFGLWINLDAPWMTIGESTARFTPLDADGRINWPLAAVRWLGAVAVVPVMEELFWRSFLMRWIQSPRFESVVPQTIGARAIVLSTFVFMLAHTLWLAAIVAGLAYSWLYRRTGRLWVSVIAHAVTNGALGIWVLWSQRWAFW